ncbi:MAG: hypothetical protein H6849_03290 [Alphaproteobacteria bacterium]|nr:MAG: hypothetical protein H6849_03290 [Alphaproteobacteria bacterium]
MKHLDKFFLLFFLGSMHATHNLYAEEPLEEVAVEARSENLEDSSKQEIAESSLDEDTPLPPSVDAAEPVREEKAQGNSQKTPKPQGKKKQSPFKGHKPFWKTSRKNTYVLNKNNEFDSVESVVLSKEYRTTAGRVLIANAKKFTSYVTLFKSPGGKCYSIVQPTEIAGIKPGYSLPLLAAYQHEKRLLLDLTAFKDVLKGQGCRKWKKINEVAILFPVHQTATDAKPHYPLWISKGGRTFVSDKKQDLNLKEVTTKTDMYKVPGLYRLTYQGKAHIATTLLKNFQNTKLSEDRSVFKDDEGNCSVADGIVKNAVPGFSYSGAPLIQKVRKNPGPVVRDLDGEDWIAPFDCKNLKEVEILAIVYGYPE